MKVKDLKKGKKIFGVSLEDALENTTDIAEALFKESAERNSVMTICSLNPEILLRAQKDDHFMETLNSFDKKIVDGFGIQLLLFLKREGTIKRFAGADLSGKLLNFAKKKNLKVGAVVKKKGFSTKKEVEVFFKKTGIDSTVFEKDYPQNNQDFILINKERFNEIMILFVFLGAPEQEAFLKDFKNSFSGNKIGICAGGTIDFWTDKKKRAPKTIRKIGMEWFWRLMNQPNRFFRICNAVIIFPIKALLSKDR